MPALRHPVLRIDDLTRRFLTPGFATLLTHVRDDIIAADRDGRDWDERDLAAALDLPVPIARLLFSYQMAWTLEKEMRSAPALPSEARN